MGPRAGDDMRVDTEPKTMPIVLPSADRSTFSSRAKDRARRDGALLGRELKESLVFEGKLARQEAAVPKSEDQQRRDRTELAHLITTLLTAGAWAPVWLWVSWRNRRQYRRTEQGRVVHRHIAGERARVAAEQRARRREHERALRAEGVEEWRRLGRKLTGRG